MDHGPTPDPYKRLFETEIDGAVVLDATTGRILRANKAAARIFGFSSPEEMVGLNPLNYVPEEDQEPVARIVGESIEKDRPTPAEIRMRTKDGRVIWISATGALIEHEGKKATLATIREITSERAKDAALREAEHQYERLFDGMYDGAVVLDISTFQIVLANKAAADMFGFASPREAVGENPLSYIPDEDRDEVVRMIALNLEGKGSNPVEIRIRTTDGRAIWISATATKIDFEGRTAMLSMLRDITSDKAKDAALKEAEEELKASEERFRTIIQNAWDAITILDKNYRVIFESPSLARMTGYTPEEWVGSGLGAFNIHPDDLASLVTHAETLKSQPGSVIRNFTLRYKHKDGSWRWIEATGCNLLQDPKVKGIVVNFRDITDRLRAEEVLRESEERLRAIVENAWDGVFILDENYHVLFYSPSLAKITGYTPEVWTGRTPDQWPIHPDDLASMATRLETLKSRTGSTIADVRIRFKHKDGSWRLAEATGRNLLHDPKVKGIVVNFRDITDRVQVEEDLKTSEERFRTLIEKATDVVIVLDATGKITYQSPSLERVTGYGYNEWVDKSLSELLIHPDDLPSLVSLLERVLTQPGTTVEGVTARYKHKDGSWHTLEATVTNMLGDPKVNGLVANFHDITERKRTEEALKDSEAKYRRVFESTQTAMEIISMETGLVVLANEAIARTFGFKSPADMVGQDSMNYLRPEDVGWVSSRMARALTEDIWQEVAELPVRTNDGRWIWISATAVQTEYHGKPALLLSILDITRRKQAEETLRESEVKYRLLTEKTNDLIWTTDLDLRTTYVSPSIEKMLGFTPDERLGQTQESQVTPDSLRRAQEALLEHLALERDPKADPHRTLRIEMEYYRKDGSTVWLENQVSGIRDANGNPIGLHGVARDISERRKAEQALKESEGHYRLLADNALDVIWVTDANLKITYASPSATSLLGYSPEEITVRSLDRLLTTDSLALMIQVFQDDMAREESTPGGLGKRTVEMEVVCKDGSTLWLEAAINPVRDPEGRLTGFQGACRDISKRKHAQEALKASEERFRTLIEKSTDAIAILDASGKLLYESPSMERITGYKLEDWLGKAVDDWLLHPDDMAAMASLLEKLLSHPEVASEEVSVRFKHKDGSWHFLEGTVRNLLTDPKVKGLVINYRDVTERVKAEEVVKESEKKFKTLFDSANDGIFIHRLTGSFLEVNEIACRQLGYTREELLRLTPRDIDSPEFAAKVAERTEELVRNGQAVFETAHVTKDGRVIPIEASSRIVDFGGKPAVLTIARDITERKKAEDSLRKSEERFRGLVETTSDWVWEIDRNSRYTYVSPKVRDILGYEPQELLGRTPFEFMHQREGRRVSKIVRRFADVHLPFSLLENTCTHKDGHSVVLETSAVPILDNYGSFLGYRGIDRDITERKKVEQELQRSLKRLEKTMESTIEAITTTIETRDPYTTGHQMRVTDLACAMARVMELPPTQIEGIRVAGLLHDIGKIAIPTEILSKPGRLNEVEYEMIKTHAKVGYNILKKIEFPWPVARAVLQHHERWNGSGYPHGIRGEDILLEARILAVADVMEAMASHRPYRPSVGLDKALDEITKNSGILYDPAVAKACVTAFTQAGFKFASSIPGAAADSGSTSSDRPVHSPEDR